MKWRKQKQEECVTAKFNRHLDECTQCRDNPSALCAVGAKLIGGVFDDMASLVKFAAHAQRVMRAEEAGSE